MENILIVDDEERIRNLVSIYLRKEQYNIFQAENGSEAIKLFNKNKIDLIILDVMMPKVSGFDLLDILRNTPETANMRIIMLTALSQESDKQRAQELGVDDYLVKSQVVIADVVERIKHQLNVQ